MTHLDGYHTCPHTDFCAMCEVERLRKQLDKSLRAEAKAGAEIEELRHMLTHALRREEALRAIVGPLRRCGRIALSDTDPVTQERLDAFFDLSEALSDE